MLDDKMFSDIEVSRHNGMNSIKTVALSYPACNAHVPYRIVICGLSGCAIFSRQYLINDTFFPKINLL
jgi:hypothetical protein